MLAVIPVCARDIELAQKNLALVLKMDGRLNHDVVVVSPRDLDVTELLSLCRQAFQDVKHHRYDDIFAGKPWPQPQNWAFQETVRHLAQWNINPWLWWEPDAVPTVPDWLDTLHAAYVDAKKPFAGAVITQGNLTYMAGVGIYPPNTIKYITGAMLCRTDAFDIVAAIRDGILRHTQDISSLICHTIQPQSFASQSEVQERIPNTAVLFHKCKDGSLVDLFLGKSQWRKCAQSVVHKLIDLVVSIKEPRLIHCVERHKQSNADAERRVENAQKSWITLYQTNRVIPAHVWQYTRDSESMGDARKLPYLKDVLLAGLNTGGRHDIVMWTNDDTILHPSLPDLLIPLVAKKGAVSSFRVNFDRGNPPRLDDPPNALLAASRSLHPPGDIDLGRDVFAFTKSWLTRYWNDIPDFLLGEVDFDLVLAAMVRRHFGVHTTKMNWHERLDVCEIPKGYVLHERHERMWAHKSNENAPAKKYNRQLAKAWYQANGMGSLSAT